MEKGENIEPIIISNVSLDRGIINEKPVALYRIHGLPIDISYGYESAFNHYILFRKWSEEQVHSLNDCFFEHFFSSGPTYRSREYIKIIGIEHTKELAARMIRNCVYSAPVDLIVDNILKNNTPLSDLKVPAYILRDEVTLPKRSRVKEKNITPIIKDRLISILTNNIDGTGKNEGSE